MEEQKKDTNYATKARSILLRKHWRYTICNLPDGDAGRLLKAIYIFCTGGEVPEFKGEYLRLVSDTILGEIEDGAKKHLEKIGGHRNAIAATPGAAPIDTSTDGT